MKPFDTVLVRNAEYGLWIPALFGMEKDGQYITSAGWQKECVPYEGNEELLGTTNIPKSAYCKVCDKEGCKGINKCEHINNFRRQW